MKILVLIITLSISVASIAQIPNFHIEGDNPIHTIEANSGNAKMQFTTNFTSTTDDWVLVYDVNDDGKIKWRYDNVSMMTLSKVGNLGIGTTVPELKLHIKGGPDATLVAGTGFMQFGNTNGVNLVIDNNEIMVRDNGGTSNLAFQLDGGEVHIGRPVTPAHVRVRGNIRSTTLEGTGVRNVYADSNGELITAPPLQYMSIPATAFHPDVDNNSVDWYSTPASAFFLTAPSGFLALTAPVILPHNSIVTRVTVYYTDADDSNNVRFFLRKYDNNDPFTVTRLADMTSTNGNHQVVTTTTNIPVDNSVSSFSFKMQPTSGSAGGYMDDSFLIHQVVIEYY